MKSENNTPERSPVISERDKIIRKLALYGIGLTLAASAAAVGFGFVTSAESKQPAITPDSTIESVQIGTNARIRSDAVVPDRYDPNNIIEAVDSTITVKANDDILVNSEGSNGDWYGIPVDTIKKADLDFDSKGDSDGVVWVNEQKASVSRDSDSTK